VTEAQEAPLSIPFIGRGLIHLGPANPGALRRLASYASQWIKSGEPLPQSEFVEWAADRVTGEDRQDLVFFLQGRRGSGKSYSFLFLGKRLGEAIARRKGGVWQDYFSLRNCATLEDSEAVMSLLNTVGKYQIVLVDDCSLAISNRSWNSPQNKNFNALLSVCRTNRWILLLTAPLKAHVDNQVREMCDITGTVEKSFHKGGFNIIKITSSELSSTGKEYRHKMNFCKKKVDYWVAFKPDPELTKEYDIQRDESARKLNTRIVNTGSFKASTPKEPKKSLAERNTENVIEEHGDAIRQCLKENPKISLNKLSAKIGLSVHVAERVITKMGLR
jgi:hypothetical protein